MPPPPPYINQLLVLVMLTVERLSFAHPLRIRISKGRGSVHGYEWAGVDGDSSDASLRSVLRGEGWVNLRQDFAGGGYACYGR